MLCVLERGKAEGGNGIRGGEATGHRMCRGEGGGEGAMVDKGIQDERNSLVVRHARFAHARSVRCVWPPSRR